MLEEFTPLVHQIVGGFIKRLPRSILREDLVAAGMSGLWDAIRRHPNGEGAHFEYYVRTRVRGAILDELRAQDWMPRRARAAAKVDPSLVSAVIRHDDLSEAEQRGILVYNVGADELLDAHRKLQRLLSYIDDLPVRERHIVAEHYFRGVKFKDLALELEISEPRISQLHSRAIARLRQFAKDQTYGTAA